MKNEKLFRRKSLHSFDGYFIDEFVFLYILIHAFINPFSFVRSFVPLIIHILAPLFDTC